MPLFYRKVKAKMGKKQQMEKIMIWGTGNFADEVLRQCDIFELYDVVGFIDNDSKKNGQTFHGKKVFPPDVLRKESLDRIVILTFRHEEIKEQIQYQFPEISTAIEGMYFFYKQSLLKRYQNSCDPEINRILKYIKNHDLQVFNYDFAKKYEEMSYDIEFASTCGMYYVYHAGKRMYFKKSLKNREEVAKYYRSILLEQDAESPHRYIDEEFDVFEGDVVVDVGAAEGNFSLQVIDRVSKLYIIESDDEWIAALKETFKSYGHKVTIFKSFVTSMDLGKYTTLDSLVKEPVNFIKMDIEGNEWDALLGAKELIARSQNVKCAICAYHADCDEFLIKDVFSKYGMESSTTAGYMWFPETVRQTYVSTRLCRGVVRGIK